MNLFERFWQKRKLPCAAVIVAAGSGERMRGVDKIMAIIGGKPVIAHTIAAFEAAECIDEIVVVARREQVETIETIVRENGFQKVKAVVPGGGTRNESVKNGLAAVSKGTELAAIQDGARPLVRVEVIERTVAQARKCHAAAPAVILKDTVKEVDDTGRVVSTPDREVLRAVQTPQVFQKDLLLAAWQRAEKDKRTYTDDCGALEALGVPVYLIEGSEDNMKITTPLDLFLAEHILASRTNP